MIVVSPDVGGVVRARGLAKRINAPLAIVDKRRERPGESEVANVIGEVDGGICILVDDIVDSGGTLVNAADALLEKGATRGLRLHHPRRALGRRRRPRQQIQSQGTGDHRLDPADQGRHRSRANIRVLSIATLIGEAISRTAAEESVSSLFD